MWLAKKINQQNSYSKVMSGNMVDYEVVGDFGEDHPSYVFPYGIDSIPLNNEELILLDTATGRACAGVVKTPKDICPGEIKLYSSGGAFIKLTKEGTVVINGVTITKDGTIIKGD